MIAVKLYPVLFFLSMTFLLTTSCTFEEVAQGVEKGMYFDLNDYLNELSAGGFDTVRSVEKVVIRNGNREVKNINQYNISQEWELMRRNDINTKALQGRYDVDTTFSDGQMRIGYRAQDPTFAVDSLFVTRSYGSIRSIEWNQSIQSIITDSRQQVIFRPDSGIEVRKTIDPLLSGVDTFTVLIRWE